MINISKAEFELYYWQIGGSSFSAKLFELIAKADIHNQNLLAKGYPDEVEVYKRFSTEPGYWDKLKTRIQKGNN